MCGGGGVGNKQLVVRCGIAKAFEVVCTLNLPPLCKVKWKKALNLPNL